MCKLLLPPLPSLPLHSVLLAVAVRHVGELCSCLQGGWTALHLAAHEGKVDVVRLLTEAKAHVNMQTKVHTLCHVLSNVDCQFFSDDMGESMYTERCVHASTYTC